MGGDLCILSINYNFCVALFAAVFAGVASEIEWENGEQYTGKKTYEDGSLYEGDWKEDLRHGGGASLLVKLCFVCRFFAGGML